MVHLIILQANEDLEEAGTELRARADAAEKMAGEAMEALVEAVQRASAIDMERSMQDPAVEVRPPPRLFDSCLLGAARAWLLRQGMSWGQGQKKRKGVQS